MIEISGQVFTELQTELIGKLWKSSKPKPRGWAMGFAGDEGKGGRVRRRLTREQRRRAEDLGLI